MTEENLKPQIIDTLYNIEKNIKATGLSERDLLILLKDRIRVKDKYGYTKKMALKNIKSFLDALKEFEIELIKNTKKCG